MIYKAALMLSTLLLVATVLFSKDTLTTHSSPRIFSGNQLKEIAFPLGGIGTGNISLGGRGELRDWEIFNRPGKNKQPNLTFFALWARKENSAPIAKILERKLMPPYTGWMGIPRHTLSGCPRFEEVEFLGEYPFAQLTFRDETVPVRVKLEAFNPFIPLDADNSGLPVAIFNWSLHNPNDVPVEVAICFSMQNPIGTDGKDFGGAVVKNGINEFVNNGRVSGIRFSSNYLKPDDVRFGSFAVTTPEKEINVQTSWYRGGWWDNAHIFWDDFSDDGAVSDTRERTVSAENSTDVATVIVKINMLPGEEKRIPFLLSWHFPYRENYWNGEESVKGKIMKNYYATKFVDAFDVADYVMRSMDYLETTSRLYHRSLFTSTYPAYVIDAVSSQASILKTNTVMRIGDGQFFGFEGLTDDRGCCPLNCTHVWNYAQTAAFLFPSLERSARETDFLHNTFDNGYMVFRTLIPLGDYWWQFKACADGQMGSILRAYREWKLSGDTQWLSRLWPGIKKSLEFAWQGVGPVDEKFKWQKENIQAPWDADKDGVMEGEQHNTYDIEFYGPNTMTGSIYLAALKAASEMAQAMGDRNAASEYLKIYKSGSAKYDRLLWNGHYYIQKVQVEKGLVVPDWLKTPQAESCDDPNCTCKSSPGGKKKALESDLIPKYQYGDGCLSDQLLGQYEAFVLGLGYVLDPTHVRTALKSIYDHNFRRELDDFANVQRVYALNDEAGLLLCSWPDGNRPRLPFVYSDEVWTGIEYQVAASLIYAGYVKEGLEIVEAVRNRHDGLRRNPWDEFECGHHYARAMASWAVLLALSGYVYDGVAQTMSFAPAIHQEDFATFWSCGDGWGNFSLNETGASLRTEFGGVTLTQFSFDAPWNKKVRSVKIDAVAAACKIDHTENTYRIRFDRPVEIKQHERLTIEF
ncbi:MAG: GH116 family glycosyl-hydrolase [Candidatus Zhuqueibacterota bacterium]